MFILRWKKNDISLGIQECQAWFQFEPNSNTCNSFETHWDVPTIREGGPDVCPPDYKESDDRTFWIYFFLRFVGTVMLSGGVSMLDPIALTMIQKYGGQFGRERLFSTIGMAIFSPLAGLLMDRSSRQLSKYTFLFSKV